MSRPTVAILFAPGTNSQVETKFAFDRVGGTAEYVAMSALLAGDDRLDRYDIVCLPGGFSYGDHLGAGNLAGTYLKVALADQLDGMRERPVLTICNGFQIAVRAGLFGDGVTLTSNSNGTFVNLQHQAHVVAEHTKTAWLAGLEGATLRFPCAHGEGRFVYSDHDGWRSVLHYPDSDNPDGSMDDIAGITTDDGLVFGLMDHPERSPDNETVLQIFANGVRTAQ